MPKLTFKKEEAPKQVPNFVAKDLTAWLAETQEKDGMQVPANLPAKVHAELTGNGVAEMRNDAGRLIGLKSKHVIAEILNANTKIDETMFTDEYVNLRARTSNGAKMLMDGVAELVEDSEGNETSDPSVCKYFNQGYGILARNAAAARIRTKVEGPDKALEAAARDLARAKGWTFDKAFDKVKRMAAED
jgi:hypothetical protein